MEMTRKYLFLFLFSLVLSASGLASLPVVDRDEARFVQATKQMAESGDYMDIRFQDASRYKKPIGIYWLQSAAVGLSGEGAGAPIWIYRLVSALGIAIAVVATAWTAFFRCRALTSRSPRDSCCSPRLWPLPRTRTPSTS